MPVDQHSDSISIFFLPFCLNFKIDKKFQNINKKLFKTYIVSYVEFKSCIYYTNNVKTWWGHTQGVTLALYM